MKLICGSPFKFVVTITFAAIGLFSVPARAQQQVKGEFSLSQRVRWGRSMLPTGDYTYLIESDSGRAAIRVLQKGGNFSGLFFSRKFSVNGDFSNSRLILEREGDDMVVSAMHVKGLGAELEFGTSNAMVDEHSAEILSPVPRVSEFFEVVNPNNEKLPSAQLQEVYLSACEAVERKFNMATPIRPRMILRLGAVHDRVQLPDKEVQLKRWNEYRFAQGVVELALRELVSTEEKADLIIRAVDQARATVSVCELKNCVN